MSFRAATVRKIFCTGTSLVLVVGSMVTTTRAQEIVATIPIPSSAASAIDVNVALNKVYTSGGAAAGQRVVVIDGRSFEATVVGSGSDASVDRRTDRYWAADVYSGSTLVRDGATNDVVTAVTTGYCPMATSVDSRRRRAWVGAQCGGGNDPVFAVDSDSFDVIAGPIGSGGVMGQLIANPATGRLYLTTSGVSKRIDPTTLALTTNAFGAVRAVDSVANLLYALAGSTLQLIKGKPDPEVIRKEIPLAFMPTDLAVNTALEHLYVGNGSGSSVEVLDSSTGSPLISIPLGGYPLAMAADSTRGRLYVIVAKSGTWSVYVIEDLSGARDPRRRGF